MIPEVRDHYFGTRRATWIKVACAFIFTAALVVIPVLMPNTNGAFTAKVTNPANSVTVAPAITCRQVMGEESGGVFVYQLDVAAPVNLVDNKSGTAITNNISIAGGVIGCKYDTPASMKFEGKYQTPSYVTYNVPLAPPTTYTQELWFKTAGASADWGGSLMGFNELARYAESGKTNYQLYLAGSGNLYMANDLGSKGYVSVNSPQSVADGNWHHVIAVRDASAGMLRLYLDGKLVGEVPAGQSFNGFSSGYWRTGCTDIGSWPTRPWSGCFTGNIAFAAVYNRAFTQQDVTLHYKAGTG